MRANRQILGGAVELCDNLLLSLSLEEHNRCAVGTIQEWLTEGTKQVALMHRHYRVALTYLDTRSYIILVFIRLDRLMKSIFHLGSFAVRHHEVLVQKRASIASPMS